MAMRKLILMMVLAVISSSAVGAGEPFVKSFHKSKNWTVIQAGIAGEFKTCELKSSLYYLDSGKNPQYGTTYLTVSYPSNNVTFSSENIGAYFRISKRVTLQVGKGKIVNITPEKPNTDKSIVEDMLVSKGADVKIKIDFGSGDPGVHTFSALGFAEAYKMLPACAGISSAKTKDEPPPQGSKITLTLDSFLTSGFAKQYGITKQGGWALKDGSFNNDLSVTGQQGAMLSTSTKGSIMVETGLMFLGTSSLDSSKMSFISELLKTLDPSTAQIHGIRDGISKSLSKRVSQIDLAPARTYGKLQVRAANVGGDAVISIKLQ